MENEVRVRFPPSPSGYLHIGNARSAIFNWLYARKHGGKLVLRIEDTDVERTTEDSITGIIEALEWLGITWDEGPYLQSRFIQDHVDAANRLLKTGHAYKCFCTKEELEAKRETAREQKGDYKYDGTCRNLTAEEVAEKEAEKLPFVIRLKVPREEGSICFEDAVYGFIEKRYEDIEDFVIIRSNGQPLYILSNSVDDIRDRITHIIRGQDGLSNTPKQILIYKALGAPVPKFAHMSFTLDTQKTKISKRKHGEIVAVNFYKEHGFLPWAFFNFLALLGWSTSESRQFFTKEELIEAFTLEGLNKANSIFDVRTDDPKFFTDPKAISINAHYIRSMPIEELTPYIKNELEKAGIWDKDFENDKREWFQKTCDLIRARFNYTTDFPTLGRAYFSDDFETDKKALDKNILKFEELRELFPLTAERLEGLDTFSLETTEEVIRAISEEKSIKPGIIINGIRTAITGQAVGPGIFEILIAVGQERVVKRLRKAVELFEKQTA
jgi:glutamyl-tRNA synthetase